MIKRALAAIKRPLATNPPRMNNIQFTKWLKTISDKRLDQILQFVYNEGVRRGRSKWWSE